MGSDIPLWIGGLQKWVTGVSRHTTCEEVVRAVLSAGEHKHRRDPHHYTIVERWHKVERPLDPRSRLLKVWTTWGLEQCNVRFLLKRAHHSSSSSSTTPRDVKAHRRKHSTRNAKTWHPRKLRSESEDEGGRGLWEDEDSFPATEEQLRNLIASQNEAIAAQLKRLHDKDEQIEKIEDQIHAQRVNLIGANYVLDTYRVEEKEPAPSSTKSKKTKKQPPPEAEDNTKKTGDPEEISSRKDPHEKKEPYEKKEPQAPDGDSTTVDLFDHCIDLYEKVLRICDQIHQEELTIRELTRKIQRAVDSKDDKKGESCRLVEDEEDPEITYASPERLGEILQRTKNDIERLLRINQTQQLTIQQNERTLGDCNKIIEDKHYYLQHLKSDIERLDQDNTRLQEEFSSIQDIPVERGATCETTENGDSNSDTGLSSLHSSSDDGAPVLNTLV